MTSLWKSAVLLFCAIHRLEKAWVPKYTFKKYTFERFRKSVELCFFQNKTNTLFFFRFYLRSKITLSCFLFPSIVFPLFVQPAFQKLVSVSGALGRGFGNTSVLKSERYEENRFGNISNFVKIVVFHPRLKGQERLLRCWWSSLLSWDTAGMTAAMSLRCC